MKQRWSFLFWSALVALAALAWLGQRIGASWTLWVNVQVVGVLVASAVAFGAMIRDVRAKWPAAVVLVTAGPMGLASLDYFTSGWVLGSLTLVGPSLLLMSVAGGATIIGAIAVLVRPVPAPPAPPPIAPARAVDRA